MKHRYDKEDDVLMIWFSKDPIDYAEQVKNIIVHYSKERRMVLMEILNASKFLKETSRSLPRKVKQEILSA